MYKIFKDGRRDDLRLRMGQGGNTNITRQQILNLLGAASATNDGYMTKEDWILLHNCCGPKPPITSDAEIWIHLGPIIMNNPPEHAFKVHLGSIIP